MRILREHPNFRRLWLGQVISAIGDRMVVVVLALYVTERTGDPAKVGIVLAAYTAPLVILLLLGGVWADRLPRQRIMIATDLVRFALHALLAALILAGAPGILLIAVIEAAFGAAEAFFRPAYTGLVPQTVPEHGIQAATAITSGALSAAELIGPAIGTLLFVVAGAGWAYALDASDVHRQRGAARPRAREGTGRADRLGLAARRPAGGLPRGAGALLGVGHRLDLLAGVDDRLRAVGDARPDRRPPRVRRGVDVRRARRPVGSGQRRGRLDRPALAPAAPHALRPARVPGLAGVHRPLRARRAAARS